MFLNRVLTNSIIQKMKYYLALNFLALKNLTLNHLALGDNKGHQGLILIKNLHMSLFQVTIKMYNLIIVDLINLLALINHRPTLIQ